MGRVKRPVLTNIEIDLLCEGLSMLQMDYCDVDPDEPSYNKGHVFLHKKCSELEHKLHKMRPKLKRPAS